MIKTMASKENHWSLDVALLDTQLVQYSPIHSFGFLVGLDDTTNLYNDNTKQDKLSVSCRLVYALGGLVL